MCSMVEVLGIFASHHLLNHFKDFEPTHSYFILSHIAFIILKWHMPVSPVCFDIFAYKNITAVTPPMTLNKLCTRVVRGTTHTKQCIWIYQQMSLLVGAFLHTWYRLFVASVHTCQHLPPCSPRTRAAVLGYVVLAPRVGGSAGLEVSQPHSSWQGPLCFHPSKVHVF